ncbi:DUF5801 repeats-in-toxin domain-containing protein, partial [Mesorhizobium sp. BAC0120]|uniref:DUF5801 repeats-in-toxin domain-containing protein n=1 Tax=Mesorhizobium sp. BAC0120 TaxID=3090670 RepID=UPI00298CF811
SALVNFGADGPAAGGGFSFTADAAAAMAALGLQSKGGALSFAIVGNSLIGYVDNGNGTYNPIGDRTVLSFTLDSHGNFTFRLYDQLDHVKPAPGSADDNTDLVAKGGSINAIDFGSVIKATDGDGDSVTLTGKANVTVRDDVPVVNLALTGNSVVHDETPGAQGGTNDVPAGLGQLAMQLLFSGIANKGNDPDVAGSGAIGYAYNTLFTYSSNTGADEPSSKTLSLQIVGGNGVLSGLKTTTGDGILLFQEGGFVVGRVGGANGQAAFAIAIDGLGGVSVAQYLSLAHGNTGSAN